MTDRQRHGLILLLVFGLIAASAVAIATNKTFLGLDLKGGVELVYKGEPTAQSAVTQDSLQRAVDVMENRVNQLGVSQAQINTQGRDEIDVQLPDVTDTKRAIDEVGSTARLEFYDWEANALVQGTGQKPTPTVAKLLQAGNTSAQVISQGTTASAPGSSSEVAGGVGLYDAVKFAAKQPATPSANNGRDSDQYFLFAAPGSAACKTLAADNNTKPITGVHCLLGDPVEEPPGTSASTTHQDLLSSLPAGVSLSEAQQFVVKPGTVVLEGSPASFSPAKWPAYGSPLARYYVLHDNVALFGNEITNPEESTDSTGAPDVSFGFTSSGAVKFQKVTAAIAQRGQLVSIAGQSLEQHFAVALDNQLVTVPYIDYKLYPDGIGGNGGADISGNFTIATAQNLAQQLRLGALPIKLRLISTQTVSATLGKQSLHQGLIAGIAGLAIVVLFLLVYYRALGAIAVAGLVAYGIYFYALIKLIPITLSLAGIAGLILTIGVAADANIVIFERVKEEIRAGRSIRQGIAIGYRKGLTAIIDANVVTIMTAFILFVLATQDVKGFAFTLGVGTFTSLFTAVLATQAILMTLGDSRLIASPSALGAGGKKHRWTFDFMGASKYFFSMSGVILLVGALAIGGRGLNLGIDFTSGTQITVGLNKSASVNEIKSVMATVGQGDAVVQRISGDKSLGPYGYQIASKPLGSAQAAKVQSELTARYGVRTSASNSPDFNNTTVGATFGSTVAHSAIVAIIVSLLVISLYVALRFDWKFAVPVLIALMHDLLITAGVYALTGRVVSTDTVAALLTILGYSMYDTIIVFDRVRENVPRMPRAAFSQIVNRSMAEVLTRSLATTSCTLLPVIALLLFGGPTLKDFAFALLIGVASGAYSSIFIASPVLTHWKEREHGYRQRKLRIAAELGHVPAYADDDVDVEPSARQARRAGRLTSPTVAEPQAVSAAEFELMKAELGLDEDPPARRLSSLTKRAAHVDEEPAAPARPRGMGSRRAPAGGTRPARTGPPAPPAAPSPPPARPSPTGPPPAAEPPQASPPPSPAGAPGAGSGDRDDFETAPDVAENDGVAQVPKDNRAPKRPRNRRHGRR
jgi:SecD/SecF fusion protein